MKKITIFTAGGAITAPVENDEAIEKFIAMINQAMEEGTIAEWIPDNPDLGVRFRVKGKLISGWAVYTSKPSEESKRQERALTLMEKITKYIGLGEEWKE